MAYLGKTPSQAVRQRYYFTASGGETSLSGADDNGNTLNFTDGAYVDVYLNGVLLVAGTDYNTSTANTIGGLTALSASDVVELVVYDTFAVFGGEVQGDFNVQNGTLTAETVTASGLVTAQDGLVVDNDGATVATFDRATSDGTIVDLQKNGTTVGSIGTFSGFLNIANDSNGLALGDTVIYPSDTSAGGTDGVVDLGGGSARFKDLYLSGGIYLGGTTAVNYLDDYEKGSGQFTSVTDSSNNPISLVANNYYYKKIGDIVVLEIRVMTTSTLSGEIRLNGMPFQIGSLDTRLGSTLADRAVIASQNSNQMRLLSGNAYQFFYGVVTYATSR